MGKLPVLQHPAFLERLRSEHPHTIMIMLTQPEGCKLDDLTCFAFALGLHRSKRWAEIEPETYAVNTAFIEAMIEERSLVEKPLAQDGDLIVYSRARPQHAGLVLGDRVISKWGSGRVYTHGRWEVPEQYGLDVRFFTSPAIETVEDAFLRLRADAKIKCYSLIPPQNED